MFNYNSTSIWLLPGMSIKLKAPECFVDLRPTIKHKILGGGTVDKELIRGFLVENEDVGNIEPTEQDEPAVIYHHRRFDFNRIVFHSRVGGIHVIDIMAVPVHDHSSIVSGGPAYGTYFSDDQNPEVLR